MQSDTGLLDDELAGHPAYPRLTFELARAYHDVGRLDRALALYMRRVELGGSDEETFYAAYQAGVLTAGSDPLTAVRWLLDAAERQPRRAEPLHELARTCRLQRWHWPAYAFARWGLEIPCPKCGLCVDHDVYEWGLLFELSVAAYWVGRRDEARETTELLLARGCLPPEYEAAAVANLEYCPSPGGRRMPGREVEQLEDLAASLELGEVRLGFEPVRTQHSPTIAADGPGFLMIVQGHLVRLDGSLEVIDVTPIGGDARDAAAGLLPTYSEPRLLSVDGRWYALALGGIERSEQARGPLLLGLEGARIESSVSLRWRGTSDPDAGWSPVVTPTGLRIVSSLAPTTVLTCDPAHGALRLLKDSPGPAWAGGLRGGSQGLKFDGGYVLAASERYSDRLAAHRLVLLDDELQPVSASPRFTLAGGASESCAGLTRHRDDLVLSFGIDERTAVLARVREKEAAGLLSFGPW